MVMCSIESSPRTTKESEGEIKMNKKSEGKVTLPLDEYNDLYARVVVLENAISFTSYSTSVELHVDLAPFEDLITELLEEKYPDAIINGDKKYAFQASANFFAEIPSDEDA